MDSASDESVERSKIFCIGLARTGTSSLHSAFQILGVPSAPTSVALMSLLDDDQQRATDHPHLDTATAFSDNPVPFLFERLDALRPGSRFVLTTRPREEWLESMRWLFGPGLARLDRKTRRLGHEVHQKLYGIRRYDSAVLGAIYDQHTRTVGEFFVGREADLLRVETSALRWEPLCDLVGCQAPAIDFPHANSATRKRQRRRRFFSF